MTWLHFFASVISSLAWPVCIIVLAFVFRAPLLQAIKLLRTVKWKELEAQFGENLDKVEEAVSETVPVLGTTPSATVKDVAERRAIDDRFEALLEISPNAAVVDAWLPIEDALIKLAALYDYKDGTPGLSVIRYLEKVDAFPASFSRPLMQLRNMRNAAAHPIADITPAEAGRFGKLAKLVLAQLEAMIAMRELDKRKPH